MFDLKKYELIKDIYEATNITLNGRSVYVKPTIRADFEVLGCVLARILDIPCASCYTVSLGSKYVISEDLNSLGDFTLIGEIVINDSEKIMDIMDELNGIDIRKLINIYIYDLLFQNCDRNRGNYGLIDDNIYILDNESIFDLFDIPILTAGGSEILAVDIDKSLYKCVVRHEISSFMLNFGKYTYILKDAINKVTPQRLGVICTELGMENNDFLEFYKECYMEILSVLSMSGNDLIFLNETCLNECLCTDKLVMMKN